MWAPHVSGWERGGERGRRRLGPTWAERGEEREGEEMGRKRPKDQEGEILNFFKIKQFVE